jgi:hypothetical protein
LELLSAVRRVAAGAVNRGRMSHRRAVASFVRGMGGGL